MRRTIIALVVFLAFPLIARVQQHAPTAAVCQADLAVWGDLAMQTDYFKSETASTENKIPSQNEIHRIPIREVIARELEMGDCAKVDPDKKQSYYDTLGFYRSVHGDRLEHFVIRHGLYPQFAREDDAGKR
jgi:hypothetical protein